MTFDPHPPRVVRPDKAPPLLMTKAQKLEAIADAGRAGRGDRPLHAGAVAVGSGNVRAHRARRLAARRRGLGRRQLPVRPRSRRQLLAAAHARRPLRLQGREDRSGALQGLRRQQHADPPAGQRGAAWTRRARCSGHQYFLDGTVVLGDQRGRTIGFPTANLCTDNELLPPHGVYATTMTDWRDRVSVGDQHRDTADRRPVGTRDDRDARLQPGSRPVRHVRFASGFVQRLRDERAFESLDLLRAQIAADCQRARVLFDRLSL